MADITAGASAPTRRRRPASVHALPPPPPAPKEKLITLDRIIFVGGQLIVLGAMWGAMNTRISVIEDVVKPLRDSSLAEKVGRIDERSGGQERQLTDLRDSQDKQFEQVRTWMRRIDDRLNAGPRR